MSSGKMSRLKTVFIEIGLENLGGVIVMKKYSMLLTYKFITVPGCFR